MFTRDTPKKTGWKKTVIAALTGIACVAIGATIFDQYEEQNTNINVTQRYTETLIDHATYAANQGIVFDRLINEGEERKHHTKIASMGLEYALIRMDDPKRSPAEIMKQDGSPAMDKGLEQQEGNVKWGEKTGDEGVKPEQIQKSFADSAQFAAEISKMFPESYGIITTLRQDLKIHHFDLAGLIKDVALLATTTRDNFRKSIGKLDLRKSYADGTKLGADGKPKPLTPNMDEKVWRYEIKYNISQLEASLEECDKIIAQLKVLQKKCAKTQDDIEAELEVMKVELKRQIERAQVKIDQMEKEVAAAKCSWWQAILTLGIACIKANDAKKQLQTVQREFKDQLAVSKKLFGKMDYFDGLSAVAATLTAEATGLLEQTKKMQNRLDDAMKELKQDYTDEEIEDNLWDEDFANEFAERLYISIERVTNVCEETITDCEERKARLQKALIWGDL